MSGGRPIDKARWLQLSPVLDELLRAIDYERYLYDMFDERPAQTRWENVLELITWLKSKAADDELSLNDLVQRVALITMLERGEDVVNAEAFVRRAYNAEPTSSAYADSLGWALFQSGKYDDAVTMLEKAASIENADATIFEHLGDAYWRAGRRRNARCFRSGYRAPARSP